jgi:phosphoribosylaminoimidazole (AIR) synthetase
MADFIVSNGSNASDVEEVFNLGVGMIAIVEENDCSNFVASSRELGLDPVVIGHIKSSQGPAFVSYV